uniref:SMB domain-containing protein n=1 Tax=Myripristis murdjan TaxID=586833 RepID=A0A667XS03_9TELE
MTGNYNCNCNCTFIFIITFFINSSSAIKIKNVCSCLSVDPAVPHTSCKSRCYEPFDDETPGCRCDAQCVTSGNCCYDYHDLCLLPTQQWQCSRLRCGEARLADSRCHCSSDCEAAGDCCTNYRHVCHGETEWVEDLCEDLSAPQCPARSLHIRIISPLSFFF